MMKKGFTLLLALALVLTFAACGGGSSGTTNSPASQGDANSAALPSSVPVSISAITYEWPDNDYTAQVPKTPDTIKLGESYEMQSQGNFVIQFAESVDNSILKAYAEELKAHGFANTISEDEDANGHYWFSAYNDAGYNVVVRHQSMSIVKPQ